MPARGSRCAIRTIRPISACSTTRPKLISNGDLSEESSKNRIGVQPGGRERRRMSGTARARRADQPSGRRFPDACGRARATPDRAPRRCWSHATCGMRSSWDDLAQRVLSDMLFDTQQLLPISAECCQ